MILKSRDLTNEENWMVEKYGQDKFVTPFEIAYEFHARDFGDNTNPIIFYEYHLVHDNQRISERLESKRSLMLLDPKDYLGIN